MSLNTQCLRQSIRTGLVALCALSLVLSLAPIAEAGYNPPSRRSAPRRGTTMPGGVRGGCGGELNPPLTLLAPASYVGQTTSTHPTVVWFVPDPEPYLIEVTLFEQNPQSQGRGTPVYKTRIQSAPGLMALALPQDQPGVTVGKKYTWQVAMLCNPNRPSKDQWVETEMEVVALPAALQAQLAVTTAPLQRASLYAESGFWYDALAEAAKAPAAKAFQIDLLKTLSQLEAAEQQSHLTAIASLLEQRP
jgi:hypothetical protein